MKTGRAIVLMLKLGVSLWVFSALPAWGDWLALDGQNTIWRLADTNGAVINQFAHLSPYHQVWNAMAPGPNGNVCVSMASDINNNQAQVFGGDGTLQGSIIVGPHNNGMLVNPGSLAFGPDGNLYIVGAVGPGSPLIARYNGTNGAFMGVFITNTSPYNLIFGKDANLYVADRARGIVRYDGATGAYLDTFVPLGTNGVPDAVNLCFGPDANLYVCSGISNAVIRFDGGNGQFIDYFVASGSGGLSSPNGLVFGPDGNLYVSGSSGAILRYDGRTGQFLNAFGTHASLGLVYLPYTPPTPVQITIQFVGGNLVQISWPGAAGTAWMLYRQQNLGPTNNAWSAMTNQPAVVGGNYTVTDSCATGASFYRLQHW